VLLVLRLLAVYFATAAGSLWIAHRFVSPVRLRAGLFLSLAPFLLVGKAMVTAGVYAPIDIPYQAPPLAAHAAQMGTAQTQTPLLGDVVTQELPWRKAVRDAAKNGRLPLWNRFVLAGEPLLAVQQPVVLYPATWIGMVLPLAQAWTFEMALRFFLALLCAYLFLRELACGEIAALLGAAAWAFCDYLVFFVGYPLTPAAAPLPLLLLGLRRLVSRADARAVTLTVVALLLILTSGHPETLLHCVAGGGLYFLFELAFAGRGRRLRPFLLSLLAGVLTLGLSAVLLLPLAEALPQTIEHFMRTQFFARVEKTYPGKESLLHTVPNAVPYLFGVSGKGESKPGFHEPCSYAGSLTWPFAAAGLLISRRREKWALFLLVALGVAINARAPGLTRALSTLPLFDIALNERMVFLAAFGVSALAALGAESVLEEHRERWVAVASLAGLALLGAVVWLLRREVPPPSMSPEYFRYRLLLQAAPLLLLAAAAIRAAGDSSHRGSAGLSAASAALFLLLVQRGLEERDLYPTYPNRVFYPSLASLERIPRELPYRMTAVGFSFVPNIAALYELEDVRGYEAMTFRPLLETYPLWCVPQPVWFNRVDDPGKPFLSFMNVRWVYAPPGFRPPTGWPVLYRGEEGMLLENPLVLPRAFVPRELAYEPDPNRRVPLLSTVSSFAARGVVGKAPPAGAAAGSWLGNGQASVGIASYSPQRLALDVDAQETALVATSVTAWPGWKLTIDGRRAPLLSYNHAFLGFRVPPGRHTAVLLYMPDGFLAGLSVSAATLVACAFLSLRALPFSLVRR
jgi:hypothetical protein